MRRFARVATVLAASAAMACSERTLSEDAAARLISALDGFKQEAHIRLEAGVPLQSSFGCYTTAELERSALNRFVRERGWVRTESRKTVVGFGAEASCPAVVLTPAGEIASRQWTSRPAMSSDETVWLIPIDRRQFVDVIEISAAPDGSTQVEFDWTWVPNEVGAALRESAPQSSRPFFEETRRGRAFCRRDNEWRCQLGIWATSADAIGQFSF